MGGNPQKRAVCVQGWFRCSKNVAKGCKRVKMSDKCRKRVQKVENGCKMGVEGWDGCVGLKMSGGSRRWLTVS